MTDGHMITIADGKRPATYIVGERDVHKALDVLKHHIGASVTVPADPVPISAEELEDHGVHHGQVKRLLSL